MSGEERRGQIVAVAAKLFSRFGFRGTTTRLIATHAGISEAAIFRHFAKKKDLYMAIIEARCADPSGSSRLVRDLESRSGKDVFTSAARFLIEEHQKDPEFMRLFMYSALEKHELSKLFIKTRGLELVGFLEGHVKKLVQDGLFREVDPKLSARAFLGMVIHYSVSQELYGLKEYGSWPNDKVISTFVDIFFEGLLRR